MNLILKIAAVVARSTNGSPVSATVLVALFYVWFSFVESIIERLIFGQRFEHWLDPLIGVVFIGIAGACVYACAIERSNKP